MMQQQFPDLWAVWRDPESLRGKARSRPFANWTRTFIDRQRGLLGETPSGGGQHAEDLRTSAESARDAAFAYVLTGDRSFADRAMALLRGLADAPGSWMSSGHADMYPRAQADLFTAEVTKATATALSWISPAAPEDFLRRMVEVVAERGAGPIHEGAQAGAWWADGLNSNWTAVLNGGLVFGALVLHWREPDTAASYLAYARARLVEMLDLAAEEGAGVEGAGYWLYCFGSILDAVEVLTNTMGDDMFSHPFWSRCSRFLPYLALPDFSAWVNYADTAYQGIGGSHVFHGVAARRHDGLAQWFGDRIVEEHGGLTWKNLIYHDAQVVPSAIDNEPCCRFFASIHLASFRSSWDPEAVFLLFKGGSNAWSHTHLDLNSFFISAYGERLAVDPGPDPYSIHYWHSVEPAASTAWHNCIVVDGGHQRVAAQYAMTYDLEEAGDCYSRLDSYLEGDTLAMIRGDASTAYGDTLSRAWRDIVYLKPDVFVVFDDLIPHSVRCHRHFEWMVHSEHPFVEVAGGFEACGAKARLHLQLLFPRGWEAKRIEGRSVAKAGDKALHALSIRPYWHHKWNVDPTRNPYPDWDPRGDVASLYPPACRYLVVLMPLRENASPRFSLEPIEYGTALGVKLVADDETAVVLFNPDGDMIELAGVRTDGERVVIRDRSAGLSWATVRARTLSWDGRTLLQEPERLSCVERMAPEPGA